MPSSKVNRTKPIRAKMEEVCILDSLLKNRVTRDQIEKSITLRIDSKPITLTKLTRGKREEKRKLTRWLSWVRPERNKRLAATKRRERLRTTTSVEGANVEATVRFTKKSENIFAIALRLRNTKWERVSGSKK